MNIEISTMLKQKLIYSINEKYNTNYNISDISTIRFAYTIIAIQMNDESRFDIYYSININRIVKL